MDKTVNEKIVSGIENLGREEELRHQEAITMGRFASHEGISLDDAFFFSDDTKTALHKFKNIMHEHSIAPTAYAQSRVIELDNGQEIADSSVAANKSPIKKSIFGFSNAQLEITERIVWGWGFTDVGSADTEVAMVLSYNGNLVQTEVLGMHCEQLSSVDEHGINKYFASHKEVSDGASIYKKGVRLFRPMPVRRVDVSEQSIPHDIAGVLHRHGLNWE